MELKELIALADKGYPNGLVQAYFDEPKGPWGDTLAEFIVIELKDTYDADAEDDDQISVAARVITRAVEELQSVLAALYAPRRSASQRLRLISEVHEKVFQATATFEQLGCRLAYLLGSIADDSKFQVLPESAEDGAFLKLIQSVFPADHEVFRYIEV